jgi:uncharacterized membrane protein YGL010W
MEEKTMKTLEEQMSFYGAYHRDRRNRATHFIGVPLIMFSLLVAFGWLRLDFGGITISAAMLLVVILLGYYFRLDAVLGAAMTLFTLLLLYSSEQVVQLPYPTSFTVFLATFVGGWILQLIGHYFEGRKPALTDNFFQVFVAPVFVMAEVFFALGWRPGLCERIAQLVETRVHGHSEADAIDNRTTT